jgi:hypothetical protein
MHMDLPWSVVACGARFDWLDYPGPKGHGGWAGVWLGYGPTMACAVVSPLSEHG